MAVIDVPYPTLHEGYVLVQNSYSVISGGTEGKTVTDARKGYIAKARSRQKEVKQIIGMARSSGIRETYDMVMNKLDAPSPLGYSTAGTVMAVEGDAGDIRVGDVVACAGANAVHAEIVAVPKNLCAKVPDGVSARDAAFSTIAAIALQGIRQADLRLGESCMIIGLGLIGQLTVQMLKAAGVKVIGVDIDERAVQLAEKSGADMALVRESEALEQSVLNFTRGQGVDAVIVTAGTSSLDPVNLAGAVAR